MEFEEPVAEICGHGTRLIARGETTHNLYLTEYKAASGTFSEVVLLSSMEDVSGAIAIGPSSVYGFGEDLLSGTGAALRIIPLESGDDGADKNMGNASNIQLPKVRVGAKLASGCEPALLIAWDGYGRGKLYSLRDDKLVAVSLLCLFVCFVNCSLTLFISFSFSLKVWKIQQWHSY